MVCGRIILVLATLTLLCGCQSPQGPIFPDIYPPIVWPPPPDRARIRYIGELRGEASLDARPTGMAAVKAVLAGPAPTVEFSRPTAVAVVGERAYVADTGLAAVHVLDLATRHYQLARGAPADPLRVPLDIVVSDRNTLVVVDRGRAALDLFDLDGNWRATRRCP